MIELKNRVALVTGSSRGIGRAIALGLAEQGVHLAINYLRKKSEAEDTATEIRKLGVKCLVVKANVADDAEVIAMFEKIKAEYGQLDILVSNAASGVLKPVMELTTKHWDWAMNINARALLTLTQQAVVLMPETGGSIVAVSSLGAVRAFQYYTTVGSSKGALESLVRHLAVELAPKGIRVNTVQAGAVDTDALRHFPNREALLNETLVRVPAGRLITPEDVADAVLLLCSDRARMIIGQTLVVDGGYAIMA